MGDLSPSDSLPIIHASSASKEAFYDAAYGRVFNHRRPDRQPRAVVKATTVDHVVSAVKLAKKEGIRVSVRSGGHSWAAWSVRDDAILIDLGNFKQIDYDSTTHIVKVSPSTTGRMLNGFLTEIGRLFAGGHCPDVGLGGFLLQGGMGWNCKNWGWACEQIAAIEVVTAAGDVLLCDEDQNADLFWAARGAGPGFPAIVTSFHLKTRAMQRTLHKSVFVYPRSSYDEVMAWVVRTAPTFDPSTEIVAVASYGPGSTEPTILAAFTSFAPTKEAARVALQPAYDSRPKGAVLELNCIETSLVNEYTEQGAANPEKHRYCCDNAYVSNDLRPEEVASTLKDAFTTLPNRQTFALYFAMAPTSRNKLPDMALSMQTDHYFALYSVWEDEKDDAHCKDWVKNIMKSVELKSDGAYLGDSDFQVRRTRFWSEENGKKLNEVRKKWNPNGTVAGYLDVDDRSGVEGLENRHEWQ